MSTPVFTLVADLNLEWRDLGEAWLVFDPHSGQTHLLNPTVAAAFLLLTEAPRTIADLARILSQEADMAVPETWMGECMDLLAGLGWVQSGVNGNVG